MFKLSGVRTEGQILSISSEKIDPPTKIYVQLYCHDFGFHGYSFHLSQKIQPTFFERVTPPKLNVDTKNTDWENVSPFQL